jgi:hypothetical protein
LNQCGYDLSNATPMTAARNMTRPFKYLVGLITPAYSFSRAFQENTMLANSRALELCFHFANFNTPFYERYRNLSDESHPAIDKLLIVAYTRLVSVPRYGNPLLQVYSYFIMYLSY